LLFFIWHNLPSAFFGVRFAAIYGSGLIGIGFSVVGVIVASLNLVLDFDFIESGVRAGAPKYYGVVRSLWPDG
jgi:uncharacterized YccA/Bax inhibitor family protein